jgi:hypothetical protein
MTVIQRRANAKPISELSTQQLKAAIKNYETKGLADGGPYSLGECRAELLSRRRHSQVRAPRLTSNDTGLGQNSRSVPDKHIKVLLNHASRMATQIRDMKDAAVKFGEHPDWPWTNFVSSFASYRGSDNWTKKVEPRMADFLWNKVTQLSFQHRTALFHTVPNPIFREIVAGRLEQVYQSILAEGGPQVVRDRLNALPSTALWLSALQQYPGIGPKYARNIAMDVYHPLVQNHFAVDTRLYEILWELVFAKPSFDESEAIFKDIAARIGIDAWALDRILYSQYKVILEDLRAINARDGYPTKINSEASQYVTYHVNSCD